jgi:hypothetical protein
VKGHAAFVVFGANWAEMGGCCSSPCSLAGGITAAALL